MHAATVHIVYFLVTQLAPATDLSPDGRVQFDPIPLHSGAPLRSGEPTLARPKSMAFQSAPATPIEMELNSPRASSGRSPVRQVSAEAPLSAVSHERDRTTAPALVKSALTPLEDVTLDGQPCPLLEALERVSDRSQQAAVIKAYWRLTARMADFHWAVKELAFVAAIGTSRNGGDQSVLHAARSAAEAREFETRLAAVAAQYELAEIARRSSNLPLPVPCETPLVGPYRTNFDVLFASRTPPAGIRRVASMLPLQQQTIESQAAAVTATADAVHELHEAHKSGHATLRDVLEMHDRLSRQRHAFLMTIQDYNHAVAEYSLAVVSPAESRQTIVSTLIRSPSTTRSVLTPRAGIRTTRRDDSMRRAPGEGEDTYEERSSPRYPDSREGAADDRPRIRFQSPTPESPREFGSRPASAWREEQPAAEEPVADGTGSFRPLVPSRFRSSDE